MNRNKKKLLELRKQMKKKKPSFRRVESWRYKRVKDSWRKARGIDSQTRKKTKTGVKSPSTGYRGPKKVRGLHPSGYEEVRVFTKNDIKNLNPKNQAIKIASKIGAKKRMTLIDYAQQRNMKILNLGVSQKEMEGLEAMLDESIMGIEDEELFEGLDEADIESSIQIEGLGDEEERIPKTKIPKTKIPKTKIPKGKR